MSDLPQKKEPTVVGTLTMAVVPETMVVEAVVDITKEAMKCFTDYMKCKEQEKTERQRIKATLKVITEQIAASKEVTLDALKVNHGKFQDIMSFARENVKSASEGGDIEMVRLSYDFIITMNQMIGSETDKYVSGFLNNNKSSTIYLK